MTPPPLDPRLRHPAERPRFVLALLSAALAVASYLLGVLVVHGWVVVLLLTAGLLGLGLSGWATFHLTRVRSLGAGVRVGPESLPELHAAVEEVRDRLGVREDVPVVVLPDAPSEVLLTSCFGRRLVLVKGPAVGAALADPARRGELLHLLARPLGQVAARQTRAEPLLPLLEALGLLPGLNLLILPWRRALLLSGDRIALVGCGDPTAGIAAARTWLVGQELGPRLRSAGLDTQVAAAGRHPLLRVLELFSAAPHPSTRYAELVRFARGGPDPRPPRRGTPVLALLAVPLALLGGAGLAVPVADAVAPAPTRRDLAGVAPVPRDGVCVPTDVSRFSGRALAVRRCTGPDPLHPETEVALLPDRTALDAELDDWRAWGADSCPGRPSSVWPDDRPGEPPRGRVLCATDEDGTAWLVWSETGANVLGVSFSTGHDESGLSAWWSRHGPATDPGVSPGAPATTPAAPFFPGRQGVGPGRQEDEMSDDEQEVRARLAWLSAAGTEAGTHLVEQALLGHTREVSS
ncbi:hypothetical protein ACFFKU_12790 [Kineococcus gynurae]|uniref:Zn-dependent protease with chaperone function n=1 Tax=Kineococcus gynurae TaxID=452979 RepID=A0ABV5LQJ3_9ACTN